MKRQFTAVLLFLGILAGLANADAPPVGIQSLFRLAPKAHTPLSSFRLIGMQGNTLIQYPYSSVHGDSAPTVSAPLVNSGGLTPNISIPMATNSYDGYLSASDRAAFNAKQTAGNYITSLTGGITASGPGAATATVITNANLTGPVTSVGNATAIANGAITNAMLYNGAVANLSGTNTGDETTSTIKTKLGVTTLSGSNTGDVAIGTANGLSLSGQVLSLAVATSSIPGALSASDHALLISALQPSNYSAATSLTLASGKLLGRTTAGTGAAEEITVGSGLSFSGGSLTATGGGGGGTVTTASITTANGFGGSVATATTTPAITITTSVTGIMKGNGTGVSAASAGTDYVAPSAISNVTNDAQTKASIVPNTSPSSGQILAGNAGGTAYAPVGVSGDCTMTSTGAITCTKTNGSSFGTGATATIANYATTASISNVTNDTQTKASIVPNTAPSAGQILAGNAGGTAYAPVSVSGDCIVASTGAITCTKTNGVSFGTSATMAGPSGAVVGTTDTQTLSAKTLTAPIITGYTETVYTPTVSAGAVTISLANGTVQKVVTAANTTITLPSAAAGTSYTILVSYGGAHTVTWAGGGTIKFSGGSAPTATSVNGKYDVYTFFCHDSTNTFGVDGGRNF